MSGVVLTSNSSLFQGEMTDRIGAALELCGLLGERYAKLLCPVDTGFLRSSVSHARNGDDEYIGTNVWYAPYVEYGTVYTQAKPFLKPAIANHVSEYRHIVESVLDDE